MGFEGVKINKLNGGLGGTNPGTDNIMLLVYALALASVPAGLEHHVPYELTQAADAEAQGIDAAYDANELVLLHDSVKEFFRLAPEATLHLILTPVAAPSVIMAHAGFKSALRIAKDVKGLAIAGTTGTVTDLIADAPAVQAEIAAWTTEHRLIDFVILGAQGTVAPTAIASYPNFRELNAPNVSISIAQDPAVAAIDAAYAKYADVGAVLGMIAVRQVNENAGSVDIQQKPDIYKANFDYPLTGPGRWLSAALSDGTPVSSLSAANKKSLTQKGYIFAGSFEGYNGIFLNSSPTAVEMASDYAYIERNRTWNKAARLIRNTLLPLVKGVVKKDPQTGYILGTTISSWTGKVNKVLEGMVSADEISGFSVYINPKQIMSENSPLVIKAKVVADDIVHEFSVDLGLSRTA